MVIQKKYTIIYIYYYWFYQLIGQQKQCPLLGHIWVFIYLFNSLASGQSDEENFSKKHNGEKSIHCGINAKQ